MKIYTILSGVALVLKDEDMQRNIDITNEILQDQFEFEEVKFQCIESEIKVLYPKLFHYLRQELGVHAQMVKSFDVLKNMESQVREKLVSEGKSQSFFMYTYDQLFIVKSLRVNEYKSYKQNINKFIQHYKINPHTLINKIYAVIKFKGHTIDKSNFYLMICSNVSCCDKRFNYRTYDLKGSSVKRQCIKDYYSDLESYKLREKTLKDLDFQKLEKCIYVEESKQELLKQILISDVNFL